MGASMIKDVCASGSPWCAATEAAGLVAEMLE
jgi:hypothetical protein